MRPAKLKVVEVEAGKRSDRPRLAAAMALAKRRKATLLVAKLDRLSRSVAFIATLMDSKGFALAIADMPGANRCTSSNAIAIDLNARGIAAPNGSKWFPPD